MSNVGIVMIAPIGIANVIQAIGNIVSLLAIIVISGTAVALGEAGSPNSTLAWANC